MRRIEYLSGSWEFHEVGSEEWKNGWVPGCVQLDFLRSADLKDPFHRLNEFQAYALEGKDWVYRKKFRLSAEDIRSQLIRLVFEGIDTYADVYLNGQHLGKTENMFMPYTYDVKKLVRTGENTVEVHLKSTVKTIKQMEKDSPFRLQSSCESARPYVRKAQYAFGWDWGPRIVQIGVWRPVYLEFITDVAVTEPFFYTEALEANAARVRVQAKIEGNADDQLQAEIILSSDGQPAAQLKVPVTRVKGRWGLDAQLRVENPRIWWPNGLGEQPLYNIEIKLWRGQKVLDETLFRSGIRTVDIEQTQDVEGRSFILRVNGVRVFAKGANWVPADSLLPRLTRADYDYYVGLAREANMNMLRVWGGGIYEDSAFYRACDEMGILVWQDFMYACAQYPDELDWFQKLARQEAEAVIKELRNYPSLAIWCGNNENNWGFDEWWHVGQPKYLGNYVYREILPQVCAELDPSRPYWVSSPYGGEHPNSMSEGDRHSWTVWSNWQDYGGYLRDTGRFVSEFGFQAMPTWRTVRAYTTPEDRRILSPVIIGHNKMVEGTERLVRFLVGRIGFPKDLKSFVYLTQFNQAEAIKFGVEHWRLRKFMTSGTLYWQLNDCWPVASWSSVDYYKRKKGLYYYTRRFFAPILPVLRLEGERIVLRVVSDLLKDAKARLRVTAYHLDGRKLGEVRLDADLLANQVTTIRELSLAELGIGYSARLLPVDAQSTTLIKEYNGELLDSVLYVDAEVDGRTYSNYLVFDRFRNLDLRPALYDIQVNGSEITVRSPVPAFGAFIETEEPVDLDDNCLILEPGVPVTVHATDEPKAVHVYSVYDLVARI